MGLAFTIGLVTHWRRGFLTAIANVRAALVLGAKYKVYRVCSSSRLASFGLE